MKCGKQTVTLRWFQSAETFLLALIGAQDFPLAYAVREKAIPDPQRPALLVDKCYSDEHNSIKNEMVAWRAPSEPYQKSLSTRSFLYKLYARIHKLKNK